MTEISAPIEIKSVTKELGKDVLREVSLDEIIKENTSNVR
jgi:hypothetical protein